MGYVVAFLAVALFPIALAAFGVYLAAIALDGKKKIWAFVAIGFIAGFGVLTGALQQLGAYHSDLTHEKRESDAQAKLDNSLEQQAYMREQLDSISLMIGNLRGKSADPIVKQYLDAVAKMAQSNTASADVLKREVVAIIRDLRVFQAERGQVEDAADGSAQAIPVGTESVRLFQQRFSERIRKLAAELPQYLSKESRQLSQIADGPLGNNSKIVDPLLEVLRSVSASL
jgi:hypothetical protein